MIDEKRLIKELEKIFETDEQNIDCTLSDFAYHVFDCIENQPKVGEWIPCSERLPDKESCADESTDEDGLVTVETTEILPSGKPTTFIVDYMVDTGEFCTPYTVIAWRERPEPYKIG